MPWSGGGCVPTESDVVSGNRRCVIARLVCRGGYVAPSSRSPRIGGAIAYLEFEGGFLAIDADDGTVCDPVNLQPEFQVPGLSVLATVRVRHDPVSPHMVDPGDGTAMIGIRVE